MSSGLQTSTKDLSNNDMSYMCIHKLVSRSFHAVSSSILLKYWLPSAARIVWYAASVFLFNCIIWSSAFPLWLSISPRYL